MHELNFPLVLGPPPNEIPEIMADRAHRFAERLEETRGVVTDPARRLRVRIDDGLDPSRDDIDSALLAMFKQSYTPKKCTTVKSVRRSW